MNVLWTVLFALLAQTGTIASIEGIVVKLGTGEPLARATVTLRNDNNVRVVLSATTGADGRFAISNIQTGEYRLQASHPGPYMPADYGQSKPTRRGSLITITAGQKITALRLELAPTSSISGRILDSDGEPLGRVEVQALQHVYDEGRKVLVTVQSIRTNDLGEYRLRLLPPGRYYIRATMQNPDEQSSQIFVKPPRERFTFYQPTFVPYISHRALENGEVEDFVDVPVYFPGTIDSEMAEALEIHIGENRIGMDFTIGSGHRRAHRVRGKIIGSTGQPVQNAAVEVVPRNPDSSVFRLKGRSAEDGSFDVAGVVSGSYFVLAEVAGEPRRNSGVASGRVSIEVADKDLANIPVVVVPNFKISARVVFEGYPENYVPTGGSVLLAREPVIGLPSGPTMNLAGTPEFGSVGPGDYRIESAGAGFLKSARLGTSDILIDGLHLDGQPGDPIEIVLARAASVEGRVVDSKQQPVPNAVVVLVPPPNSRRRADRYAFTATDASGRFRIQNVPGDYKLFAWEDIEPGAWQDPAVIRIYENRGQPISLISNTQQGIELTVIQ
jgi:protocatechuate 3,4-dioxygenase beta subunit